MKKKLPSIIFASLVILTFTNCKKCYECSKPIEYYSMDTDTIFSSASYEEETCERSYRKQLEELGYTCTVKP